MKTVRFTVIITLFAFLMANMAYSADIAFKHDKKIVNITFKEAIRNPGLVAAMYQQLDKSMLNNNLVVYVFKVEYQGNIYRITGTFEEWTVFFRTQWRLSTEIRPDKIDD